jgi:hypothetical protein
MYVCIMYVYVYLHSSSDTDKAVQPRTFLRTGEMSKKVVTRKTETERVE